MGRWWFIFFFFFLQKIENITQIILDAHDLVLSLQRNHRPENVQIAAIHIQDQAFIFCSEHFIQLLASPNFLSWSKVKIIYRIYFEKLLRFFLWLSFFFHKIMSKWQPFISKIRPLYSVVNILYNYWLIQIFSLGAR